MRLHYKLNSLKRQTRAQKEKRERKRQEDKMYGRGIDHPLPIFPITYLLQYCWGGALKADIRHLFEVGINNNRLRKERLKHRRQQQAMSNQ